MAGFFTDGFISLEQMGILDVVVPFILIFTVVFAVLQKTKILGTEGEGDKGKPRKNFNSVIALVMALAVVIPHVTNSYPSEDSDIVNIINKALPNVSVILVAVVMLLLIIGVFGKEVNFAGSSLSGWAVIFALVAVVLIFGSAANIFYLPGWLDWLTADSEFAQLAIAILVFAVIIWFITKEDKEKKPGEYSTIEDLGRIMGYKK